MPPNTTPNPAPAPAPAAAAPVAPAPTPKRAFLSGWKGFFAFLAIDAFLAFMIPFVFRVEWLSFGRIFMILLFIFIIYKLKEYRESRMLAKVIIIFFSIILLNYALEAYFPMLYRSLPWYNARVDFALARPADSTEFKTDLSWDAYRSLHGKELRKEYNQLLADGRTEEAAKLKMEFMDKWDREKWEKKFGPKDSTEVEKTNPKVQPISKYSVRETATLHKGETWFPSRQIPAGTIFHLTVAFAPVSHTLNDGTTETVPVGAQCRQMAKDGQPAFTALGKYSEITLEY